MGKRRENFLELINKYQTRDLRNFMKKTQSKNEEFSASVILTHFLNISVLLGSCIPIILCAVRCMYKYCWVQDIWKLRKLQTCVMFHWKNF